MSLALPRALRLLTPAAVLGTSFAAALGPTRGVVALAFAAAATLLAAPLHRAWSLARRGGERLSATDLRCMKLHLLLHVVPLAYAGTMLLASSELPSPPLWALGFAPFFLSGHLTWKKLHARFGTFLYALFARGNLAVGFTSLLLAGACQVLDSNLPQTLLERLLLLYAGIHFLLTAFAVRRIADDFEHAAR